jgi:hypothetical protein
MVNIHECRNVYQRMVDSTGTFSVKIVCIRLLLCCRDHMNITEYYLEPFINILLPESESVPYP